MSNQVFKHMEIIIILSLTGSRQTASDQKQTSSSCVHALILVGEMILIILSCFISEDSTAIHFVIADIWFLNILDFINMGRVTWQNYLRETNFSIFIKWTWSLTDDFLQPCWQIWTFNYCHQKLSDGGKGNDRECLSHCLFY